LDTVAVVRRVQGVTAQRNTRMPPWIFSTYSRPPQRRRMLEAVNTQTRQLFNRKRASINRRNTAPEVIASTHSTLEMDGPACSADTSRPDRVRASAEATRPPTQREELNRLAPRCNTHAEDGTAASREGTLQDALRCDSRLEESCKGNGGRGKRDCKCTVLSTFPRPHIYSQSSAHTHAQGHRSRRDGHGRSTKTY